MTPIKGDDCNRGSIPLLAKIMIQNKFYLKRYLSYGSNNFELSSKWNQFVFEHNIFVDEQYFKSILVPFKSFIDRNQSFNFSILFSIKPSTSLRCRRCRPKILGLHQLLIREFVMV